MLNNYGKNSAFRNTFWSQLYPCKKLLVFAKIKSCSKYSGIVSLNPSASQSWPNSQIQRVTLWCQGSWTKQPPWVFKACIYKHWLRSVFSNADWKSGRVLLQKGGTFFCNLVVPEPKKCQWIWYLITREIVLLIAKEQQVESGDYLTSPWCLNSRNLSAGI